MRLKENYVLRQVADVWVVLPLGEATMNLDGMIKLNETGMMLWRALEKGAGREQMAEALMAEYAVEREQVLADVDAFVAKLAEVGCIEM